MVTLENAFLRVQISQTGAILQSVYGKQTGIEYLWQGDKTYWGGRAPNLFPFVGRLYQKTYTVDGKPYTMECHGFLPKVQLEVERQGTDSCSFLLQDSEATRAIYPYAFALHVEYALKEQTIAVCFRVENRSEKTMYCGFGGHPGFNVPMEQGLSFQDYRLEFPEISSPKMVHFSDGVLDTGERTDYALLDGTKLPLRHDLFNFDAVVLEGMPRQVRLVSDKSSHGVEVSYPEMGYVGFWHKPKTDAPYVCIEPWSVLPGREGVTEELTAMKDMTAVAPGGEAAVAWSIRVW